MQQKKMQLALALLLTLQLIFAGIANAQSPNPPLANTCGLDVVLVIDNSGSINSSERSQMQSAFNSFVNALLPATPTEMAVIRFGSTATVAQNFTHDRSLLATAINNVGPTGGTNWESALLNARTLFPHRTNPDLILFTSDGHPSGSSTGLSRAIQRANTAKTSGIRIETIGIGEDLITETLKYISSDDAVRASDFGTFANELADLAITLCGGTISVKKVIDEDGDLNTTADQSDGQGWHFDISLTGGSATSNPTNGDTDSSGSVNFDIDFDDNSATATAMADLTEVLDPSYNLIGAECTGADNNGTFNGTDSVTNIQLIKLDIVSCTFYNEPKKGTLEIIKALDPPSDPGQFNLLIDGTPEAANVGDGGSTGTVTVLTGLRTVGETAVGSTDLDAYNASITCVDNNSDIVTATPAGEKSWSVNVAENQAVVCTITNNRRPEGTLTVVKQLIPATDPGLFTLQIDGVNDPDAVNIGDGGSTGPETVYADVEHTISEVAGSGTNLADYNSSVACQKENGSSVAATPNGNNTWSITPLEGKNVTCIMTNERKTGTLEVIKILPEIDPGQFNLQIDGVTDPDAIDVGNGGSTGPEVVNTGTHTVGEIAGTGTNLSNYTGLIACKDSDDVVLPVTPSGNHQWAVDIDENDNVVCEITNSNNTLGILAVDTIVDWNGVSPVPSETFNICITGPSYPPTSPSCQTVRSGGNLVSWGSLEPGDYTVVQNPGHAEWWNVNTSPSTITVSAGEVTEMPINNVYVVSSITVIKQTEPVSATVSFSFEGDLGNFSLSHDEARTAMNLAAGSYTITELPDASWKLTQVTCTGNSQPVQVNKGAAQATIKVKNGEEVTCDFLNKDKPTAIELISFEAVADQGGILLTWETASEIDNEGFNIWRSETENGEYAQINPALIPAEGNTDTGASYEYIDTDVVQGQTYWYKLEDIDTTVGRAFYGPISVTASD